MTFKKGEIPKGAKVFIKGESGNPAGRPPGVPNTKTRLQRILNLTQVKYNPITEQDEEFTIAEQMDIAMIKKALEGDIQAYKELVDRLEGKANQQTEVNLKTDSPISTLTAEQIKALDDKIKREY